MGWDLALLLRCALWSHGLAQTLVIWLGADRRAVCFHPWKGVALPLDLSLLFWTSSQLFASHSGPAKMSESELGSRL